MASFFLILPISLLLISPCQGDLIDNLCHEALNPSLCNTSLRSDPRSSGANLRKLAEIALEKARSATNATITVAKSITDESNKKHVDHCVDLCNEAILDLDRSKNLVGGGSGGRSGDLQSYLFGAAFDLSSCDDEFGEREPSQLKVASREAQDLVDVVFVIVDHLE